MNVFYNKGNTYQISFHNECCFLTDLVNKLIDKLKYFNKNTILVKSNEELNILLTDTKHFSDETLF